MNISKKYFVSAFAAILSVFILCACGGNSDKDEITTADEATSAPIELETEPVTEIPEGEMIFKNSDISIYCTGVENKNDSMYLIRFTGINTGKRKLNAWVTGITVNGIDTHKDVNYLIAGLTAKNEADGTVIIKKSDFSEGEVDFSSIEEISLSLTVTDENDSTYSVEKTVTVKV